MEKYKELIQKVRELAERFPNRVYKIPGNRNRCCYLNSGDSEGTGCIFGVALLELGYPIGILEEADESTWGISISELLERLEFPEAVEPNYIEWCSYVQNNQDDGVSWAESVKAADELYGVL